MTASPCDGQSVIRASTTGVGVLHAIEPEASVSREAWAMGTRVRIAVRGGNAGDANGYAERILSEIEDVEQRLSTWRTDSALSRLNRAPVGVRTAVDPGVGSLLAEVRRLGTETGGAFDVAIGALVDAWGLRDGGHRPDEVMLAAALKASGASAVEIDDDGATLVRRDPAAWIDAGAFGKGAALAAIARLPFPASVCGVTVDLGGQVWAQDSCLASGTDAPAGAVWVADPRERSTPVVPLDIRGASVATSGASERWVDVDGERLGHIVDPRTGNPVSAWGSVTVVSRDPLEADAFATALFVMGPDIGRAWAESHGIAALFLVAPDTESGAADLRISWTTHMEQWLG